MKYAQIEKTSLLVVAIIVSTFKPEFDEETMKEFEFIKCDDDVNEGDKYENGKFIKQKKESLSKEEKLEIINQEFKTKRESLKPKDETLLELWKEQEKEAILYSHDKKSKIPVIETLAKKLGISKEDYVAKVNKKVQAYKVSLADLLADEYIEENKIKGE